MGRRARRRKEHKPRREQILNAKGVVPVAGATGTQKPCLGCKAKRCSSGGYLDGLVLLVGSVHAPTPTAAEAASRGDGVLAVWTRGLKGSVGCFVPNDCESLHVDLFPYSGNWRYLSW